MTELSIAPRVPGQETPHWTARHGKPIVFVILTLVAVGVYLAITIPIAVFPDTDFPRVTIGADKDAVAPSQPTLPAPAKVTTNRMTFAAFPIMGYSLTSDSVSQTQLWEMANYEL